MKNTLRKVLALLLVLTMLFAFSSVSYADNEGEDPAPAAELDKGELLTTKDGRFQYYKYVLETQPDEATTVFSYILEIAKYIGTDTNVTVPAKLDEPDGSAYAVRIIGTEAFLMEEDTDGNQLQLKNVVLPDTVETIGVRAFCNNKSLMTVTMPDGIKKIDSFAFYDCKSLAAIHMPENLEYIGDSAFAGCDKFAGNAYITSEIENDDGSYSNVPALRLPNGLKYIGDNAFTLCTSLICVYIPDGITEICTGTFTNCYALEYVVIPETVETIGAAFNGAYINHNNKSTYTPKLIIRNPHCKITPSPEIDKHVVVYGVKYSAVNAFADKVKCKFEPITVEGHTYVGETTAPTCTEKGYTTYHCDDCEKKGIEREDKYVTDYVDATGHDYGKWYKGLKGEKLTEEELKDYVEPTCTVGAVKSRKCNTCSYIEIGRIAPLGHNFVTTTTATCTTDGRLRTYCTRCNTTTEYRFQAALGHDWDEGVVISEWEQCVSDGIVIKTCQRDGCLDKDGNQTTVREITPKHTDANNDNKCDLCGATIDPVEDCKCFCHAKSGFKAFFYQIQLIVWKLFKIYKVCDCGVVHY